jgi:small-conductance mechanosensitive channel
MRQLVFATAALLLAASLGCRDRNSSEVGGVSDTAAAPAPVPEVRDTAPTTRDFSFDQRQEFAQSVRDQLAQIDQEIQQLAAQAKSVGGAVSDRALANIRASRRAVNRNLQRVEGATAANWESIKSGVSQSVESLNESIEGAQPK